MDSTVHILIAEAMVVCLLVLLAHSLRHRAGLAERESHTRRLAEHELRETHQVLEGILGAIPARVFWKDRNLVLLGCNRTFAHDAGFSDPKEVIGKDDFQMAWRDQAELYRSDDRAVMESGRARLLIEEPQTTPAGDTLWLLTSKVPLRDAGGEICGVVGTYIDITERKRAEAEQHAMETQLHAKQKLALIGTMARGMAHEINNPIMGAMNYAQLIQDMAGDNTTLAEFAGEIMAETRRVSLMTHSLLRFTENRETESRTSGRLAQVVDAVLAPSAEVAGQRGIDLSCTISSHLPPIVCRPRQIGEAVSALLMNAVEAWGEGVHGDGRKISVSAEEPITDGGIQSAKDATSPVPERILRLTVDDNGPGMSEETLNRAFDPFFSTKDRTRHSGLGLWICRSIVEQHGGEIVLSSAAGNGTCVRMDLPIESVRNAHNGGRKVEKEA